MATVIRTELNQQTARVLARVEAGEELTVTDRARPIARLSRRRRSSCASLGLGRAATGSRHRGAGSQHTDPGLEHEADA